MGGASPELMQQATAIVTEKNHNFAAGSSNWFNNLPEENQRYVPFNGGISEGQLHWLEQELLSASSSTTKCFLFCHMAIYVKSSREQNLLWNCEDVIRILHGTPRGTVLACFAGHDHNGGYATDEHGIHFIVPPSPIECEEGEDAFGYIEVCKHQLRVMWTGKVPSCGWPDQLDIPPSS